MPCHGDILDELRIFAMTALSSISVRLLTELRSGGGIAATLPSTGTCVGGLNAGSLGGMEGAAHWYIGRWARQWRKLMGVTTQTSQRLTRTDVDLILLYI